MKKIAWFVVLAYLVIFVVLTWPLVASSFAFSGMQTSEPLGLFCEVPYWIFIVILLLCEAGLLLLPMRIEHRRPVSRRHVVFPIIVAGFLAGALLVGVIGSLVEFFQREKAFESGWLGWSALAGGVVLWIVWGGVFYRISKSKEPENIILLQCKRLLQGSVIALFVAVPTHIVARCRDYCCAGFYTFIGITFGIAVMLLSFGPGIYFLYAARWRRLHPDVQPEGRGLEAGQDSDE